MKARRCLPVLLLVPAILPAQETRGVIFGRVLDPSGAPVAGASVTVENMDTGTALRLTTNSTGYHEANFLLPGNYRLTANTPASSGRCAAGSSCR